ncbi:MAG TPA: hypothetical protein EYG16_10050 [Deltaproteobacteria bacterium]|nr:hypothetical protein [Candidatus Binatota bacterium]HIL13998.1 hypothetical protein [Deltaproteobacteria bacterium]
MSGTRAHLRAGLGSLLALAVLQSLVESVALLLVYRDQVIPPYSFFANQLYDFLAKLRYAADGWLSWLPSLPNSFTATGTVGHLSLLADLLPATVAMALLIGTVGSLLGRLAGRRCRPTARGYLWAWAGLALVVHATTAIRALSLAESPSLKHLIYRSRSLVVDGTLVALAVLAVSLILARLVTSRLENSRRALPIAALACLLALLPAALPGSAGPANTTNLKGFSPVYDKPNVLLISLDSLRADHVSAYGYHRATTPALEKLAADGIRFDNAISTSSWTLPTHLTMFTSRYQLSHGVVHDTNVLDPGIPVLGEIMKAAGYSTAGFVSAPYVAAMYGYARGMDEYLDLSAAHEHRSLARKAIVAPDINANALRWLDQHADEPFFLFLHYFDIHYDYVPPAPYDTMFDPGYEGEMDGTDFIERKDVNRNMPARDLEHILALYDGEIRFTDEHVGRVLARIDELGLRDNTLVIVVSDHGDEFFEHGNKGHHRTLYQEVLRVPLIVRLPDGRWAGESVSRQASLVDILPTIMDVAGLDGPPVMEGLSLLELRAATPRSRERAVYGEFFDKRGFNLQIARRLPTSKTIQHFNRITHPKKAPVEYYDLARDAEEQHDLAEERREELRVELDGMGHWSEQRWRAQQHTLRESQADTRVELDSETLERLKSLGYVGE